MINLRPSIADIFCIASIYFIVNIANNKG